MNFLEHDRRFCRTYTNLEASVQKELSFYQQKAKEWAEVRLSILLVHLYVLIFSALLNCFFPPKT